MKAHFEKVPLGSQSLRFFERRETTFPFHWHYHPEFELTLIEAGHGQRLVGDGIADYAPGDLVLLGPDLPHSWRSNPSTSRVPQANRAIVVQFRHDFLGKDFFSLHEMKSLAALLERAGSGLAFASTSAGQHASASLASFPTLSAPRRLIHLLEILQDLAEEKHATVLTTHAIRPIHRPADQERLDLVCSYLDQHFRRVDFAALSRSIHLDQSSLCRFFKRATGRTMTAYVNELRIGNAAHLLTSTTLGTLQISLQVGFENYAHFARQFRRLKGCSPAQLRRQLRS
jgi:AraC-like DNA-binding protein